MSIQILYSIIGSMSSVLILLLAFIWKTNSKREDEKDIRLVTALNNLSSSLVEFKETNQKEHATMKAKMNEKTNELGTKIVKLEVAQSNVLCPVTHKRGA